MLRNTRYLYQCVSEADSVLCSLETDTDANQVVLTYPDQIQIAYCHTRENAGEGRYKPHRHRQLLPTILLHSSCTKQRAVCTSSRASVHLTGACQVQVSRCTHKRSNFEHHVSNVRRAHHGLSHPSKPINEIGTLCHTAKLHIVPRLDDNEHVHRRDLWYNDSDYSRMKLANQKSILRP